MERFSANSCEDYSKSEETRGNPSENEQSSIIIGKEQNEDVSANTKYQPCHNFMSNSALIGDVREKHFKEEMDIIFSEQESTRNHRDMNSIQTKRRVIELSDNDSKMVLRQQLEMADIKRENSNLGDTTNYEDIEILRKLPPDTIVIRQETKSSKEDSDYARELTETNSSGSSSTSGYVAAKVKRIPRAVRNKTRETMAVRRNPMRVSKKDIDKDFPRPRQRLLTNNKREVRTNYESGKRSRVSTMPYMNTRSVTRKMYTVGATYQAPTRRDETEWREWPVHGMHERPVFHPQAGLAVEYLGRYFTSLNGLSYCEIIDEPEIEVVAVDPHCDQRSSSAEKKLKGKSKARTKRLQNPKEWSFCLSEENKSFETCMHGSLHCVLGYCSQIMTPSYKQTTEDRTMKPMQKTIPAAAVTSSEPILKTIRSKNQNNPVIGSSENVDKLAEETKLLEGYAIAMAQTVQNKNTINYVTGRKIAASTSSSSMINLPEAQKSIDVEVENSKTTPQAPRMNLKRILHGAPNSSLILLRSSGARTNGEICKVTKVVNPTKLEETSISDEALMEISSIYKKLVSSDESLSNHKESPARGNFYTLKRNTMTTGDLTKKTFLKNQLENVRAVNVAKETNKSRNANELKIKESDAGMSMMNPNKNRMWCTSETSEIAKILSEYNRSTARKSAIQGPTTYGADSRNLAKTNFTNSNVRNSFWQKTNRMSEENRNTFTDRNTDHIDLSQRKWKRFQVTLEKPKNTQIVNNNQHAWNSSSTSSENRQTPLRDRQMKLNVLSYVRENSLEPRKDLNEQCDVIMVDEKSKEERCCKDETETSKAECLQELLENTAVLYCAANGVHQKDLSNYIDTLDSKQSMQWLENWNHPTE